LCGLVSFGEKDPCSQGFFLPYAGGERKKKKGESELPIVGGSTGRVFLLPKKKKELSPKEGTIGPSLLQERNSFPSWGETPRALYAAFGRRSGAVFLGGKGHIGKFLVRKGGGFAGEGEVLLRFRKKRRRSLCLS